MHHADFDTIALAAGARATLCPYGAHLLRWRTAADTRERLFLSERAEYRRGAAIRGGVPVIFPQFAGRGPLPKHGFARHMPWQLLGETHPDETTAQAELHLCSNEATRALWPHDFEATYSVTLTDTGLALRLTVTNTGDTPCEFTAGLHTYFAVGDIHATELQGLQGRDYENNPSPELHHQTDRTLRFTTAIDRVYHRTAGPLRLVSPQQATRIENIGFADTVVWNPWQEGARAMGDMEESAYRQMLCVEAASVVTPVRLNAGAQWAGEQRLAAD